MVKFKKVTVMYSVVFQALEKDFIEIFKQNFHVYFLKKIILLNIDWYHLDVESWKKNIIWKKK